MICNPNTDQSPVSGTSGCFWKLFLAITTLSRCFDRISTILLNYSKYLNTIVYPYLYDAKLSTDLFQINYLETTLLVGSVFYLHYVTSSYKLCSIWQNLFYFFAFRLEHVGYGHSYFCGWRYAVLLNQYNVIGVKSRHAMALPLGTSHKDGFLWLASDGYSYLVTNSANSWKWRYIEWKRPCCGHDENSCCGHFGTRTFGLW